MSDISNKIEQSKNVVYTTKEQILAEIDKFTILKGIFNNEQLAIKLIINSMYGAMANIYFSAFNLDIASAVTLQGQELIKFAEVILNDYFLNEWHLDFDLHEQLGLTRIKKLTKPVVIYIDTDSVDASSKIRFRVDELGMEDTICIEDMFNQMSNSMGGFSMDAKGNEFIDMNGSLDVLNYDYLNGENYFGNVDKIIRHKVQNKSKFEVVSMSGNKVTITGDHSLIINRGGVQLEVKPSELLLGDELIEYDE